MTKKRCKIPPLKLAELTKQGELYYGKISRKRSLDVNSQ